MNRGAVLATSHARITLLPYLLVQKAAPERTLLR
jgi:hypothetical protein